MDSKNEVNQVPESVTRSPSFRRLTNRQLSTYSASAGSSSHFANTISPYTSLKMLNRHLAGANYANASGLSTHDRVVLKHFIKDYLEFHKKNRHSKARRLVFSPSGSGLGDRFGCMLFAYWAAVVSQRVFLVKWEEPFPLQDFLTEADSELNLTYNETEDKPVLILGQKGAMVPDALELTGASLAGLDQYERILASRVHTVFMNTNRMPRAMSDQFVDSHKPPELTAKKMNELRGDTNFYRAILHQVFRLSDGIERDIEKLSRQMGLKGTRKRYSQWASEKSWMGGSILGAFSKKRRPYIGVHARIGIGVGEGAARFERITKNMNVAAKCLASRAIRLSHMSGTPSLPIFLATDTTAFRDVFRRVVKEMSHGRIEVISGEWDVVHSVHISHKLEKNGTEIEEDENRRAMWSTYIDLVMLGYAEHILALYSSFPRLAAYLGDSESVTELRNEICLDGERWS